MAHQQPTSKSDRTDLQALINPLTDPHHRVDVLYPCPEVLHRIGLSRKDTFLLPVENAANRYEPGEVVQDTCFRMFGVRAMREDVGFHSVSSAVKPAPIQDVKDQLMDDVGFFTPHEALVKDMQILGKCEGNTRLKIATYASEESKIWVLVERRSTLIDQSGSEQKMTRFLYQIDLDDLESLKCSDLWLVNIFDLLHRNSDRAFFHVHNHLDRSQQALPADVPSEERAAHDCESVVWKPKRRPPYQLFDQTVAGRLADPAMLDEDERSCHICANDYDNADSAALRLQCCNKLICRNCFAESCDAAGLSAARCAWCRHKYAFTPTQIDLLKFGTYKETYMRHWRGNLGFNAWETFERTCADLERRDMRNVRDEVVLHAGTFLRAWDALIRGARLEPASSTPLHLHPARSPEISALCQHLPAFVRQVDGARMKACVLHVMLVSECLRIFGRRCLSGERTFSDELRDDPLWLGLGAEDMGLRPDVEYFVRRTVKRAVMFLLVRKCERKWCSGWHRHGEKAWYAPRQVGGGGCAEHDGGVKLPGKS